MLLSWVRCVPSSYAERTYFTMEDLLTEIMEKQTVCIGSVPGRVLTAVVAHGDRPGEILMQ